MIKNDTSHISVLHDESLVQLVKSSCMVFMLFLITIFNPTEGYTQDYKALREQLKRRQQNTRNEIQDLKTRIAEAEQQLRQNDRKYDLVYSEYQNLAREIRLRDALILKLQDERKNLLEEIQLLQNEYQQTEESILQLQENYKETLTYLYKRGRVPDVAIILSSVSINQMLIRAKYLELFDLHLRKLEDQIHRKQELLREKEEQLENAKSQNEQNEDDIRAEKQQLSLRRNAQEVNIATLKNDRKKTENRLIKLENEIESFNQTLSDLIENEEEVRRKLVDQYARLERERLRKLREAESMNESDEKERLVEKYSRPTPKTNVIETIDFGSLENEFSDLRGKMSSPVDNGIVIRGKGIRRDPLYGTKIDYPGVDIAAKSASPVRVVYDGLVFRTIPMTGYGDVVFVKHGRYITAYGNLSKIQVRENSFVKAGEIIGLSGDKDSAKGETLFFMIRESNNYLNPEDWIKSP